VRRCDRVARPLGRVVLFHLVPSFVVVVADWVATPELRVAVCSFDHGSDVAAVHGKRPSDLRQSEGHTRRAPAPEESSVKGSVSHGPVGVPGGNVGELS
jgi:hypothetical protein